MLYRHEEYQESYVHVCDDAHKDQKSYIANRPRVVVHDVTSFLRIRGGVLPVKFCPYCGKELDTDIRTNEFYKF